MSPTLRAVFVGNAIVQLGLLPIEIGAYQARLITQLSGIVPNSVLHVVLASGFVLFAARMSGPLPGPRAVPKTDQRSGLPEA